jgi:GNAT superfamily N-acetyltransferase
MEIIEYEDKYLEDVRDLLTELEEYLVSIDKDDLDHVHPEYHEKMALVSLENVKDHDGKCYLAVEDGKAIGLIIGTIPPYDEYDYLDYKCPKRGVIDELIVTSKVRSTGVGKELMKTLEDYFISKGCEYVLVDIFAYNENAINFYGRRGYHNRMHVGIKKLVLEK